MRKPAARASRRGRNDAPAAEAVVGPEVIAPELERFLSALDTLSAILEEETSLVRKGEAASIESFIQRKKEAESEIRSAGNDMASAGLFLPEEGPFSERARNTVDRLAETARLNGAALTAAREAVDHVMGAIRKAAAEAGSEGMYARSGRQVEGVARTMKGFDTRL